MCISVYIYNIILYIYIYNVYMNVPNDIHDVPINLLYSTYEICIYTHVHICIRVCVCI